MIETHASSRIEFLIKVHWGFFSKKTRQKVNLNVDQQQITWKLLFLFQKMRIHQSSRQVYQRIHVKATAGYAEYAPEKNAFIWKISQFPGGKEYVMRAHFGLPSVRKGLVTSHFYNSF
jgi:AP-1 complex subunit mu